MIHKSDILVIGGGIAGMSYALSVANRGKGRVALICKTSLDEANTAKAQGGIASVTNLAVDNFEKHIHDTMVAGDYISDPLAVRQVVCNAPSAIQRSLTGVLTSIRAMTEHTTFIVREDIVTFAYFITLMIQGLRFNVD